MHATIQISARKEGVHTSSFLRSLPRRTGGPWKNELRFKVSEKGAVSVYGMGRFPVTLYLEQWERLLAHTAELRAFIEANRSQLKAKER